MTARRTGIASVASLAALTLTVGVVHAVAPDWSHRMGLDVWNIAAAEAEFRDREADARDLRDAGERMGQQLCAGDAVAEALADGELSLAAAVEELAQLNAGRRGFLVALRCAFPDSPDRELVARYALGKVWRVLAEDPSRRDEVMKQLGGEFRSLTGQTWEPRD